ncbi:uncharacterized protein LOC122508660 [Leptopilina heterotoma]|uniref:uncharacterized protein LOC122508660 n=1 Tax=Leptopilina heterotoma TaxID=63436 RepID=UPI001CA8DDC6|nr:uncharacterized protein LOC122508660 [Leptopilina heterotoma]
MDYSKEARFFPNECYICKSRKKLQRCDCNMIAYCSDNHRQKHLPIHENFCKAIKELLKEKGLTHIYDELNYLFGSDWTKKREQICRKLMNKLGRCLTSLEVTMCYSPRVCFVCWQSKQEDLDNCPNCPVASFCKQHPFNEIHTKNCQTMNYYLNILNTADELNVDLSFLSSTFPFISDEKKIGVLDGLTYTIKLNDIRSNSVQSRLLKINLFNFIDIASKFNNSLQKIYDNFPDDILIHIDAISQDHAIIKENYWEFLLHLNPFLKKLNIVLVGKNDKTENNSLCEKCQLEGKSLNVENYSKSYNDYILEKNYRVPQVLFYFKIENGNLKKLNFHQISSPIVLLCDSNLNYRKAQYFLSFLVKKLEIIHEGQINTAFSEKHLFDTDDHFIIFKNKENLRKKDKISTSDDEKFEDEFKNSLEWKASESEKLQKEFVAYQDKNLKSLSSNSSLCSFIVISEKDENLNKIEQKVNKHMAENSEFFSLDERDANNCENETKSENNYFSGNSELKNRQSFLLEHNLYLKNENQGLREQLNSSIEEITKLQIKLQQISSDLNEKNKLVGKILNDIVNVTDVENIDIGFMLEKKKI